MAKKTTHTKQITRVRKTLSLTPEVVELVKAEAKRQDRKFSYVVNQLLARDLDSKQ